MNNQLEPIKNDMTFSEIQNQMNKLMAMQQHHLEREVMELKDNLEKQSEQLSIMGEENVNLREVQLKEHRVKEHRFGFVSLSDLGQVYQVSIGSKTMGKLLRVAGLAKGKQSKTEPLRSAIVDEYAKSVMYGDYPTYQWNPGRCIEKIERWLNKEGLIDEFYSIEDEKELMEYISELHDIYDV